MYILQVKDHRQKWRWGLRQYETLDMAQKRLKELADVGIIARIRVFSESFYDNKTGGFRC